MRTVGDYQLGPALGHGATSEVLAATTGDGREVALKLLRAHLVDDPRAVERFLAEADRARAIDHPNVVHVLEAGRAAGGCYVAMERIDGVTLAAHLAAGPLSDPEVRELGAALADGMAAAHAAGIIHRDLKPANIMLAGTTPKIVDFGIATSFADASARATGTRLGSPAYMAPEQLTGGVVSPCVDIWALGVILFEAATGRLPFEGYEDGRCPQLVEPAPAARDCAAVSSELDRAIARCLERDPARRIASMTALAQLLRGESPERITQAVAPAPASTAHIANPAQPPAPRPRRRWPFIAVPALALAAALAVIAWPSPPASSDASSPTATSQPPTASSQPKPIPLPIPDPTPTPVPNLNADTDTDAPAAAAGKPTPARAAAQPHHHRVAKSRPPAHRAGETLD